MSFVIVIEKYEPTLKSLEKFKFQLSDNTFLAHWGVELLSTARQMNKSRANAHKDVPLCTGSSAPSTRHMKISTVFFARRPPQAGASCFPEPRQIYSLTLFRQDVTYPVAQPL
jgi:hypothetical protein